jgi:hypothetical protein
MPETSRQLNYNFLISLYYGFHRINSGKYYGLGKLVIDLFRRSLHCHGKPCRTENPVPLPHTRAGGRTWVWYGVSFALGVLLTLGVRYFFFPAHLELQLASFPSSSLQARRGNLGSPGPWGSLEYERIPLLDPAEIQAEGSALPANPRWVFEGYQPAELTGLINAGPLTAGQKAVLLDTHTWQRLSNGFAILPTDEFVGGLGKTGRQYFYPVLGRCPANRPQHLAYRMPLGGLDERFAGSCFPAAKFDLLREHTYTNGNALCLCVDRPLAARLSSNELRCLNRTLSSIPTWMVRLRIVPGSNVEDLVKYWGTGGRENTIRPILASIARTDRGGRINIADLLPIFARLRLYTFPDPQTDPAVLQQDDFYTALNFFNDKPEQKYFDNDSSRQALQTDYAPATGGAAFGDLVVVLNPDGKAVHVAVFVADDIVYTKNGANLVQPWALMRVADMIALIPSDVPLHTSFFRRKSG